MEWQDITKLFIYCHGPILVYEQTRVYEIAYGQKLKFSTKATEIIIRLKILIQLLYFELWLSPTIFVQ